MKVQLYKDSGQVTIKVNPELDSSKHTCISVSRHLNCADFKWDALSSINWPSLGDVDADDAYKFGVAVSFAAAVAIELDVYQNPQQFTDSDLAACCANLAKL